jgi:two-component system chemotaxis response regulator CheY
LTKVLIVDDALFMRTMIKDILQGTGRYDVVGEATNGQEAIKKFQELQPELITMDIVMPVMDGIEAARTILKQDPTVRVVMVSALGQEPLVIESIASGAKDFVVKPFSADKVVKVIDQVMKAAR